MWFSPTCFFIISVLFTDHVATFEGYISWYRSTDTNQWKDLNRKFLEYLVSICYKEDGAAYQSLGCSWYDSRILWFNWSHVRFFNHHPWESSSLEKRQETHGVSWSRLVVDKSAIYILWISDGFQHQEKWPEAWEAYIPEFAVDGQGRLQHRPIWTYIQPEDHLGIPPPSCWNSNFLCILPLMPG